MSQVSRPPPPSRSPPPPAADCSFRLRRALSSTAPSLQLSLAAQLPPARPHPLNSSKPPASWCATR
ncbi:hypothetical protein Zm00014a_033003 [Zea mays]|uniref:Uncharacterized protein n=1 Tax=Zea mays TaxID=4577 RepID=A0A317Y3P6_MAIZE|nr:hypothetical protein Zm00014a_033003 [Zea mays]